MSEQELNVKVHATHNLSEQHKRVFTGSILPLLKRVINSNAFRQRVMTYSWQSGGEHRTMFESCDDPRHTVFAKFMSGSDTASSPDNTLDIYQTYYYSRKNTIGYTYPSTWHTWVNKKYFNKYIVNKKYWHNIIANIVHEYMHNLGYKHTRKRTPTRKHSVPYAYGRIAGEVAKSFLEEMSSGGNPANYELEVSCYYPWWGLGLIKRCYEW